MLNIFFLLIKYQYISLNKRVTDIQINKYKSRLINKTKGLEY